MYFMINQKEKKMIVPDSKIKNQKLTKYKRKKENFLSLTVLNNTTKIEFTAIHYH